MKKSGFTLIELIFVIVIIGLLAAVAVPKFLATKKNAETANFPEVGNQIVAKANEQYNLVQDINLTNIVNADADIKRYLDNLPGQYSYDLNESQLDINYTGPDGTANNLCLQVQRKLEQIPVKKGVTISTYNFTVSELNTSCNQD